MIPVPPNHGPFPDVPMGDPIVDDILVDHIDDHDDHGGTRKKNKKDKDDDKDKDKDGKPSRTVYEGCMVERLKPRPGETLSWGRCGRRLMPSTQEELISLVKRHRKETRTNSASADFKRLSQEKQGIINRIIDEKKLYEKSKTAEWTLVDVQAVERRVGWSSKETVKLQIVIKRTDKGSDKNGFAATGTHSYPVEDVIDLSVPLEKKKSKDKDKDSKKKNKSDHRDPLDDPMNLGYGPGDLPPDDRHHQPPYQDQQPYYDQPGPNHPPPQAPFVSDWQHPQNPFNPHPQFQGDPNFAGGARDFNSPNPFFPQHHVAAPGQYDEPLDTREYIHPHQGARARTQSADRDRHRERSRSQRRQSVARRPSRRRGSSRRRDDSVEDMRQKFDRMYSDERDSNSSNYDERSMWSRSEGGGRYSRSPATSLYSDDYEPRNRSKPYHRDSDPRPRYRSTRYRDADIEPGYNYDRRHRDRRHSFREQERRPALRNAITYDDYPQGRGAEPRYLPAPPMQRRNTEVFGDKRNDYFDREWRPPIVDREQDAFEAGMRAAGRRSYYP